EQEEGEEEPAVAAAVKEAVTMTGLRCLVVALACSPSVLCAAAVCCFLRLATRTESVCLALALIVASVLYGWLVAMAVAARGRGELSEGRRFWCLMALWHALLILPAAAALFSQWDLGLARQWLGCVLLALSAGKMGTVSTQRVERSARYGLVVALGKALRGVDSDHRHEIAEESLLELATARWLLEYWSQPPTFSATELRGMLAQAASRLSEE
ncbi:unnamed protein product, partial [Laminaria digitata]